MSKLARATYGFPPGSRITPAMQAARAEALALDPLFAPMSSEAAAERRAERARQSAGWPFRVLSPAQVREQAREAHAQAPAAPF